MAKKSAKNKSAGELFRKVDLTAVAAEVNQFPYPDRPEISLVGRSNVGKSTLINTLARNKNLARTSKTPGKTQQVFFFSVDDYFYLVDLPGYGYAQTSKKAEAQLSDISNKYFIDERPHTIVLLLLDIRRGFTDNDLQMADYLDFKGIPWQVVLTKADKLSRSKQNEAFFKMQGYLQQRQENFAEASFCMTNPIVVAAAQSNDRGVSDLRKFITTIIKVATD